jgi:large subunit ribosomal protein L6e
VKNKKPVEAKKPTAPEGKEKTFLGGKRIIRPKERRFYPTEDTPVRYVPKKKPNNAPRLRSSLKPGAILIILTGRFKGKRVVLLKILPSGLLLVTGPFRINGVPIRRVSPTFVIATSTSLDISSIKIDEKYNDKYFKRPREKKKKSEEEFFSQETQKKQIDAAKVKDQKEFDAPLLEIIRNTPHLTEYLGAKFSLKKGQHPHEMKF